MPVIKSAKKKLRQDKVRTIRNRVQKVAFKKALKTARVNKTADSIRLAIQSTDKAAKKHLIHKNKAARLKSALSRLIKLESQNKTTKSQSAKKSTASPQKATLQTA